MKIFYIVLLVLSTFFGCQHIEDDVQFDLSEYVVQDGAEVKVDRNQLQVVWDGKENNFRLRIQVEYGVPVFKSLSIKNAGNSWSEIAHDFQSVFKVVSGVRRVTQQQTEPLEELGIPLTSKLLDSIKWEAFWDAPLYLDQEPPTKRQTSIPATEAFANHR